MLPLHALMFSVGYQILHVRLMIKICLCLGMRPTVYYPYAA